MLNTISIVLSTGTILFLLWDKFAHRFAINWSRAFWTKRIIGIEIWFYDKRHFSGRNYGFNWKKEPKDDYEVYKSGKH